METGKGNPWSAKDLRFSLGAVGAYSVPVGCRRATRMSGKAFERRAAATAVKCQPRKTDVGFMLTRAGETVKQVGEGDVGVGERFAPLPKNPIQRSSGQDGLSSFGPARVISRRTLMRGFPTLRGEVPKSPRISIWRSNPRSRTTLYRRRPYPR